jgi:hypothetical protein
MNEFYVGYLPKAPDRLARRIRITAVALIAIASAGAFTFASVQKTFAPSTFEYGNPRSFEGVIEVHPFPTLLVKRPGPSGSGSSHYLLVGEGKHGADGEVSLFEGKSVRLKGTLIYRGSDTMIELVRGSIWEESGYRESADSNPAKILGTFELTGEIVDGKCYLGVMNPGSGKVHRDCAALCLSGGVPVLFAANDLRGRPAVLQLVGVTGARLPKAAFLDQVGQPLRIKGTVVENGNTLIFKVEPSNIIKLR